MRVKVSRRAWRAARSAGWGSWAASQFFSVCWKRSTLPWVWGVRLAVLLGDPAAAQLVLQAVAAALAARQPVVNTIPLSVRVEAGGPQAVMAARKAARTT